MSRISPSLLLFLALLLATAAAAQEEAAAFDISLANPGARSLGFGGAFVSLADDATAAFANPAGLTQFLEPELTLEIRGQGILDRDAGGALAVNSSEETSVLGFLAFVYPWKKGAVAIYRNGFANFDFVSRINGFAGARALNVVTFNHFQIDSTGLSASYRLSENFSLGAGIAQWRGDLIAARESSLSGEGFVGPGESRATALTTTDDSDFSFNAGFLWRFAEQWRLGGVYRGAPEFTVRSESRSGTLPPDQQPVRVRQFPLLLPDVIGLGVAYKSKNGSLTLSGEWDLVRYSRLLEDLGVPDRRSFDLGDGHELHLGLEYVIVRSRPVIALRAGVWLEPDHRLRYSGADPIDRATFRGGDDLTHQALGLGLAFKSLKLDLAFSFSDLVRTGSFTMIYSF